MVVASEFRHLSLLGWFLQRGKYGELLSIHASVAKQLALAPFATIDEKALFVSGSADPFVIRAVITANGGERLPSDVFD